MAAVVEQAMVFPNYLLLAAAEQKVVLPTRRVVGSVQITVSPMGWAAAEQRIVRSMRPVAVVDSGQLTAFPMGWADVVVAREFVLPTRRAAVGWAFVLPTHQAVAAGREFVPPTHQVAVAAGKEFVPPTHQAVAVAAGKEFALPTHQVAVAPRRYLLSHLLLAGPMRPLALLAAVPSSLVAPGPGCVANPLLCRYLFWQRYLSFFHCCGTGIEPHPVPLPQVPIRLQS